MSTFFWGLGMGAAVMAGAVAALVYWGLLGGKLPGPN